MGPHSGSVEGNDSVTVVTNAPKSLPSPRPQSLEMALLVHASHAQGTEVRQCFAWRVQAAHGMTFTSTAVGSRGQGSPELQHLSLLSAEVTFTFLWVSMSCAFLYFPLGPDRLFFIPAESPFQNQPKGNQSLCPCPAPVLLGSHLPKPTQREPATSPSLCPNCNVTALFILWLSNCYISDSLNMLMTNQQLGYYLILKS